MEQTRRSPFHRGPHRLTKLSEAAAQHAKILQVQQTQGPIPALPRRGMMHATSKIAYDHKNFPALPSKSNKSNITHNQPNSTTSPPPTMPTPPPQDYSNLTARITALETNLKAQQDQINTINKKLNDQQQAIERLTGLIETQQQTTDELKDAILTLTTSVSNLEKINKQILENTSTHKPSPDHEKPGKRFKLRTEETSPTNLLSRIPDDPMMDATAWESQSPNMSHHDRRSPSPSL